jgi:hypothetical protein
MDIKCRICGEPWDMDCIHEAIAEDISRDAVRAMSQEMYEKEFYNPKKEAFFSKGCSVLGGRCSSTKADPIVGMLYEVLGDDLDGAGAMMEDYGL